MQEDTDAFYIRAGGGENWHDFVRWTLDMGWPGLENLSSSPAPVGAAPVQNIGAYGLEMAEHFYSLRAYDLETGKTVGFDKPTAAFGYRDSFFRQAGADATFIAVTFRLPKAWTSRTAYADVARELAPKASPTPRRCRCRTRSSPSAAKLPDPAEIGNAGSFFKEPGGGRRCHPCPPRRPPPGLPSYPQPDGRQSSSPPAG